MRYKLLCVKLVNIILRKGPAHAKGTLVKRTSVAERAIMRNIIYEIAFIHDSLKKHRPVAAFGGIAVIALGLILGRLEMILAGGFVAFVVVADYVVARLFGDRTAK